MQTEKQWSYWDMLWLVLMFGWMAAFSYPYFFHAAVANIREFQSYNLDSADALRAVQSGLKSPFFQLTFNDYGHFYSNLSMAIALLYSTVFELTEHALINILRLNAVVGGMATVAMTYVFAKRYLGRLYAILAGGIMAFSPCLLVWSNELKPDTWQLFFIVMSIYFLARAWEEGPALGRPLVPYLPAAKFRYVLAGSAAAGAAFGCKYLGMFLLPVVGVAMLGVGLEQITDRHARNFQRVLNIVSLPLALLFGAVAVFATPIRITSNFLIFPRP
jgi:4-amino-4-deoxy-L-arabinose transferase-like glycosyltransferase